MQKSSNISQDISQEFHPFSRKHMQQIQQKQSKANSTSTLTTTTNALSTQPIIQNVWVMYLWGVGVALGAFIMGYFFVVVSVLTAAMVQFNKGDDQSINISVMLSICTTAMPLGGLIGSLLYSKILQMFRSQNKLLIYTSILTAITLILQCISLSLPLYSIIRLFQGFLSGLYGNVIPPYLMSIAPTQISGFMGSLNQIMITIGIAAAYAMGYVLDQDDLLNPYYWRLCVLLPLPFCIIQVFVCQHFGLDSIQRHIRRRDWSLLFDYVENFYEHGSYSVQRLVKSKNIDPKSIVGGIPRSRTQFIQQPRNNFQQQIISSQPSQQSLAPQNQQQVETPGLKLRRILSIVVSIVSQFSGINSILFYSNQLFLDISGGDADYAVSKSLQLGVFQIVVTLFSGAVIDRFGRKTLMIGGQVLIITALLTAFYVLDLGQKGSGNSIVAFAIFLHMAGFSLSLGPITVVYISEIVTDISPYMTFIWIQTILISFASNLMMEKFGTGKVFLYFAIVSSLGLVYLIKFMIETKGKTRQQVVRSFEGNNARDQVIEDNCLKNIIEMEEQKKDYSKVSDEQD